MSLRKNTILVIVILLILTMTVGYIYTNTVFMNGYITLEAQEIESNVRRIQYSLQSEIDDLDILTDDWAAWDDTYYYMQDYDQNYIESNLIESTFSGLELNFVIFFDSKGNSVYQKGFDLEKNQEIPVDESIIQYIKDILENSTLIKSGQFLKGTFSNNGLPVIFSARPILKSTEEGPSHGTLVFVKVISGSLFEHIRSSVDSEVTIGSYSPKEIETLSKSTHDPVYWVNLSQPDNAHFYTQITDIYGFPIFMIKQTLQRNIYQQGLASQKEFMTALLIGSIVAGTVALIALEFGFLRRILKISNAVKIFRLSPQENKAMILKGRDEISSLSVEMNNAFTQLSQIQNELTTHLEFERLLVGISTEFINLPFESIDEGISRLLQVVGEFSKADRGYVQLFRQGASNIMDVTHEWCADGIPSVKNTRQNIQVDLSSWWIKTLKSDKPILIDDVALLSEEEKSEMDLLGSQSIQSLAAIPLIVSGEFVGILAYDLINKKTEWPEKTILLLQVISAVIASVIDRKRHESRILIDQNNSATLNEITRMSIGKSTLNATCREISKHLNGLINSDQSYLIFTEGKGSINAFSNGRKITLSASLHEIYKDLIQSTQSGILFTSEQDQIKTKIPNKYLGKSHIALPLCSDPSIPGIILLIFNQPHLFSQEEISFCNQFFTQISLTILKTKALEEARQRSEELSALRATIADITSELELQKLLQTLLERAIKLMKADSGDFCVVDEQTGNLRVVASINIDKEYVGTIIPFGEGASGKVLETRETLLIDDYSKWPGRLKILSDTSLRATVLLPITKGENVLGTLGIVYSDPNKRFASEDLHILSLFAQHASIAMENALLFEKVQQMARIDEVTGLLNRRAFCEMGEYEINRALRLMHPISLAMVDLDDFKHINDQFGHQTGDEVLREVAQLFRDKLRNIDIIGRYGGDEMMILMPETNEENAIPAMDRLRKILDNTTFSIGENDFHITASFGITSHQRNAPQIDVIIGQADTSLYTAKKDGKNCVRLYEGQIN